MMELHVLLKKIKYYFYKVEENEYDNDTDQLSELYKGELEASGVSSLKVKMPALESGLNVMNIREVM